MFQLSTEICLKSLAFLISAEPGTFVQSREIAEKLGISPAYVTKALQPLARKGWLRSMKGRTGGWTVVADPTRITVAQLIDVLEPDQAWRRCVAGHYICSDETACPFHAVWTEAVAEIAALMHRLTLDRLSDFKPPTRAQFERRRPRDRSKRA